MPLLEAECISIEFGGLKAVQNFDLHLQEHELFSIIGPNGAGKTTIFNILTGIYEPTSGVVKMNDVVMNGKKAYEFSRMGIARTFQNIRLFGTASVLDNLTIAMTQSIAFSTHSCERPGLKNRKTCLKNRLVNFLIFLIWGKRQIIWQRTSHMVNKGG